MEARRSRLPAAILVAVVAAGAATLLLRPRHGLIEPASVKVEDYFSPAEVQRAEDFRDPQRLIGLAQLALTGGTLILLAAPLALGTLGWRSLWVGLALYTPVCAFLLARWVPAPQFGGSIASLRLLRESLGRPALLLLCAAFMCYVGQWISVMTWLPTFVVG